QLAGINAAAVRHLYLLSCLPHVVNNPLLLIQLAGFLIIVTGNDCLACFDTTGIGRNASGNDVEQSGFAAAIWTHHANTIARLQGIAEVIDQSLPAIGFGHMVDFQDLLSEPAGCHGNLQLSRRTFDGFAHHLPGPLDSVLELSAAGFGSLLEPGELAPQNSLPLLRGIGTFGFDLFFPSNIVRVVAREAADSAAIDFEDPGGN